MNSIERYANHSAVQLALEEEFVSWVKSPDEESDRFWGRYLEQFPGQQDIVSKATVIVQKMQVAGEVMSEERSAQLWNRIEAGVQELDELPVGKLGFISRAFWIRAAAIFIITLGIAGFFWVRHVGNNNISKAEHQPVQPLPNDLAPGDNHAVLTLADGTKVLLDSANNGAVSRQGSVTIMKMDGKLAYNKGTSAPATEILYNTISTPRGGKYQLVLSDGTRVWLNAASSLRFPAQFAGGDRKVEFTGEGYFEVVHDAAHPFIVQRGPAEIQVLGTHFNINAYQDEPSLSVTLLEGKVSVRQGLRSKMLLPGEQAVISEGGDEIKIRSGVDVEHVISWKNGLFDFAGDPLPVVMRQLSRWYDAEISYEGRIPEGHYTGAIRRQANLSEVLKMLELAGGVQFSIRGKQIVVQNKAG